MLLHHLDEQNFLAEIDDLSISSDIFYRCELCISLVQIFVVLADTFLGLYLFLYFFLHRKAFCSTNNIALQFLVMCLNFFFT